MIEITREVATRVRDIVNAGLVSGVGVARPGKLCVEAAVCLALGLPHGDDPGCVSQPLRRLKIRLNDAAWSSNQARANGLRRLAVAQLGSAGVLDDEEFIRRVVEMTIRKAVPVALRAAATVNPTHAEKLEAVAVRCEREGTREACLEARAAAAAAAAAAHAAAHADAFSDAAFYAAAFYAASAAHADAFSDAAFYAAAAAAFYAASAAARAGARDQFLSRYSEWVVEILIELKAPGCEFLDLAPLETVA